MWSTKWNPEIWAEMPNISGLLCALRWSGTETTATSATSIGYQKNDGRFNCDGKDVNGEDGMEQKAMHRLISVSPLPRTFSQSYFSR
jgi:hypothetical protein